jgi:hypothetical protein
MADRIRFAGALLLLLMAGYPSVLNWGGFLLNIRNRRRGIDKYYSLGPFLSAVLAICAYSLYPFTPKGWILIIPVLDIGNWIVLIGLPLLAMRGLKGALRSPKQSSDGSR